MKASLMLLPMRSIILQLSETNDGKQMSDNWIDKRLDDAVGKEKVDEIRDAAEDDPDSVILLKFIIWVIRILMKLGISIQIRRKWIRGK